MALGALLAAGCGDVHGARPGDDALVVLLPRDAQELDPRFTTDAYGLKVSRLLFASLVTIDPHTLEPVNDLARDVELLSPASYRVRLRPGLRFSDGSALDAEDVVATFQSVTDPALGSRYAATYRRIRSVRAVDALTVDFVLEAPHATFLTDLELPVVRAEDALVHMGTGAGPAPIGAGPYRLAEREPGRIELVENPYWHRGHPRRPRLTLLVIRDDNTRALRLLAGAGDVAINAIPPLLVPLFQDRPGFRVLTAPGVGTSYIGVNLEAPALGDRRVRQALAHAIDRRSLVDAKLGGRARLARSWIVPGHWAYSEDVPDYSYDPARARALLDAAGFPEREDGSRLSLSLRCGSDRSRQSMARAVAAMLRAVGVEVDVRPSEVATLIADLNRGRFELTMLQVPEVVEPHVLSWFFSESRIPGPGVEGANRWRLRSPALEEALERGRSQPERSARVAAYVDAQVVLARELPVIPLWHEDVVAVVDERAGALRVGRNARFDVFAR